MPDAVRSFVAQAPVCRLATASPSGDPHVVPVCPVFDGNQTLYVDVGLRSRNARNVIANPAVQVVLDEYNDDWSLLRGVLLSCRAERADGDERDHAWSMIREKFPQYKRIKWEPRLTLALRIVSWTSWGF
jgi:PPOX class probable F420-dependent enzyme